MNDASTSTCILVPPGKEQIPLADGLPMVADAGFPMVELSRHYRDLSDCPELVQRSNLRVWAVHGTLGIGATALDEEERRAAVAREIPRLESAAAFAPCPYVIHYLDRFVDRRHGPAFRKSVEELLVHAERLKIRLAVETVPDKPSNERYPPTREVADLVRSFESPWASICVDVNHSNLAEDLPEAISDCAGTISTIHVSDNHGVCEEHLLPGQGEIDFPVAFAALRTAGYTGPINLECHLPDYPTILDLQRLHRWASGML